MMERRLPRIRIRFRLQTMLVLMTAFTIALGLVFQELNNEHRRKQIAREVGKLGGHVHFKTPHQMYESPHKATGVVKGWLRLFLGDQYFSEASSVRLKLRSAEDLKLILAFPETSNLTLSGPHVTDDFLRKLGGLSQLESLHLDAAELSERGLEALMQFSNLRFLEIENCSLSDQGLKPLTKLSHLQSLRLMNCALSGGTLEPLTQFPSLQSLRFGKCSLSGENLKTLAVLPDLKSITFADCSLAESNLRSLYGARSSVELELTMTDVTEAAMLAIREASPTWSIRFEAQGSDPKMGPDKGYLPSIREMPQVTELAFQGSRTSGRTLAVLKDARSLSKLSLSWCCLTDGDLRYLQPLQNLKSLGISATPITDEGMHWLKGLKNLEALSLAVTKVEGLGLESLPSSIKQLQVTSSPISDRGVASIAKLTSLESLTLERGPVSDEAASDLTKLTALRRLWLWETGISASGVSELQQALPNCEISAN